VIYSHEFDIGFAHYPKTAGHSLTKWFRETFPDAEFVEQQRRYEISHLPVRQALEQLELVRPPDGKRRRGLHRFASHCRNFSRSATDWLTSASVCNTRIIGVVREPFDMLVSLFEYWRGYPFDEEPTEPWTVCARKGTFREFLRMAVVDRMAADYHDFFDLDGPAAANTRLLDFQSLEPALLHVCRELGVTPPRTSLDRLNAAPIQVRQSRDIGTYLAAAGSLVHDVHTHFRWYYEQGVHEMIRGTPPLSIAERSGSHRPAWPQLPAWQWNPPAARAA
jgi:hypothetical protein